MRLSVAPAIAAVLLVGPSGARVSASCLLPAADARYAAHVRSAVGSGRDVWGDQLLRSPNGPTYDAVRRYLRPLLLARGPHRRALTVSGVYYLAFGEPDRPEQIALHVADGSQIVLGRAGGPSVIVSVGGERFGSCLARLDGPRLDGGFYPILETAYRDTRGNLVRQESFVAPFGDGVASFVGLSSPAAAVRVTSSAGSSRVYPAGATYLAVPVRGPARAIVVGGSAYEEARTSVIRSWDERLAQGTTFEVPERRVQDAERNLLVQNLLMTWRYSLGNPYEAFEFPESLENAEVLAEYGFGDTARAIVRSSLNREPELYPAWEAGSRLLAAGQYLTLSHDRPFLAEATPALARNVALIRRRQQPSGLLAPEKYTADLPTTAVGLGSQAVVLQGLTAMAGVWAANGHPQLAAASRATAARLRTALLGAVRKSEVRLPDGSLFLPARLLDDERPYRLVARTIDGSYWNLVVQDALASGLFPPNGVEARGALAYLLAHGARLLGLVRSGSYALYGRGEGGSGTNAVYGLNVARFLADNDRPDQLVLSLYGQLAAGMTPNTFVSGEAASVTPLPGERGRAMYLPPNSTSNAAFLETLRLMLVHEQPDALQLAFATPRGWLAPGKRITVTGAPTRFGRVSYSIEASARSVRARLELPAAVRHARIALRLRLPAGEDISSVALGGRPLRRFDQRTGTIDLTGRTGTFTLTVRVSG